MGSTSGRIWAESDPIPLTCPNEAESGQQRKNNAMLCCRTRAKFGNHRQFWRNCAELGRHRQNLAESRRIVKHLSNLGGMDRIQGEFAREMATQLKTSFMVSSSGDLQKSCQNMFRADFVNGTGANRSKLGQVWTKLARMGPISTDMGLGRNGPKVVANCGTRPDSANTWPELTNPGRI